MKKKEFLLSGCFTAIGLLLTGVSYASGLWFCTATDARGAVWHQYAPTRAGAAATVLVRCRQGSLRPTCQVRCYPPAPAKKRWRCMAQDSRGKRWYWVADTKPGAMTGARRACIYNSKVGGCFSRPEYCSF